MLNLNTNNDYTMAFTHHHVTPNDQQFYHNLYTNVTATTPTAKDKNDLIHKNQKVDFLNHNPTTTVIASEAFTTIKDGENSKRFSVNNLLKAPSEKYNGKRICRMHEVIIYDTQMIKKKPLFETIFIYFN